MQLRFLRGRRANWVGIQSQVQVRPHSRVALGTSLQLPQPGPTPRRPVGSLRMHSGQRNELAEDGLAAGGAATVMTTVPAGGSRGSLSSPAL